MLTAWCRRRFDSSHSEWYDALRNWVDIRCSGTVELEQDGAHSGNDYYRCVDQDQCRIYDAETPLVVLPEDQVLAFSQATPSASFDLSGTGRSQMFDVPSAPWLALDRDGDGKIDSGTELFGSGTDIGEGKARNGFVGLGFYDSNEDGVISSRDWAFSQLSLWTDNNADWQTQPGELQPLARLGVVSLSLQYDVQPECDTRGNCGTERASFEYIDPSGALRVGRIVDVHLPPR